MKKTAARQTSKAEERAARPPARATTLANPGHPLTRAKPEERAHPAERKVKHKRRAGEEG